MSDICGNVSRHARVLSYNRAGRYATQGPAETPYNNISWDHVRIECIFN